MSDGQTVESLDLETERNLSAKREWVIGHYEDHARNKYETVVGKLDLLATILANRWIDPSEHLKLQCLGVTFGDALAQELLLNWVVVDDEYGRTAALSWPGTSLLAFPITMISKRVEDGEDVDAHDLFELACKMLNERAFDGRCA